MHIYITNSGSNTVSVIDTATNTITATVTVGSRPNGVAVNPMGTRVYVANQGEEGGIVETVSVIDTTTNSVIATVTVGDYPIGVAVNPAGTRVYVANDGSSSISVINTATNSVMATVIVGNHPVGVAVNPAGTRVYVANYYSETISVIDTATNSVTATVTIGKRPYGVAVNPAGTRVYITNYDSNTVSVIDTATNAITATATVGKVPLGVAVNPAGTRVYVVDSAGISVIDTATNTVTANVTVGNWPFGVAVNPAGTRVYVANINDNTVSVIDTATNAVTASVGAGFKPSAFGQFIGPLEESNRPPNIPNSFSPGIGALNHSINPILSWSGGDQDGDIVTYTVNLDANSNPTTSRCSSITSISCSVTGLNYSTTYYWKVTASDGKASPVSGPVLSFTTQAGVEYATGNISVFSSPSGAEIYLDGILKGTAPVMLKDISHGSHVIWCKKTGFEDFQQNIEVASGGVETFACNLVPGKTGNISITSSPSGAEVFVEEVLKGTAPITIPNVAQGSHTVRCSLSGYSDYETSTTITAESTASIICSLVKPCELSVKVASEPASIRPGQTSVIKVTATGKDNQSIPGATVRLSVTPASSGKISPAFGTTDINGIFISNFNGSAEGAVTINTRVNKENLLEGKKDIQIIIYSKNSDNNSSIKGTITDSETGEPVSDATVAIGSISDKTGLDGKFELKVIQGEYDNLTVTKEGYKTVTKSATVTEGETVVDSSITKIPLPPSTQPIWYWFLLLLVPISGGLGYAKYIENKKNRKRNTRINRRPEAKGWVKRIMNKNRDVNIMEYSGNMEAIEDQKARGKYLHKKNSWKDYLDFELEIDKGSIREFPVTVIRSPAGEAREIMHFPYEEQALEDYLISLKKIIELPNGSHNELVLKGDKVVKVFGTALFLSLFTGDIRNRYDVSTQIAKTEYKGLRIKLRIQAPELAVLPWEFMYDPGKAEYICLSLNKLIVRYPEIPQTVQPLAVKLPLRILGMIAIPDNLRPLDIEYEKKWIENAIQDLKAQGLVELTWLAGQTWRELAEAMQTGEWNVFHFIGHGGFDRKENKGYIALADDYGHTHLLEAKELGMLLADHYPLRLVILNCCKGASGSETDIFSSTASILARHGIPAVIAMQYRISDKAAIEFSRTFYKTILANRMPVDAAVAAARQAISIEVKNTVEWGTPVLIMHSSEGVLFKEEEKPKEDIELKDDVETEKEIREELTGNIETVEQFISFMLAKQHAIFQHERNGKKYYKVPMKGISEISTQIKAIDNKISVIIRITGYGKIPGYFYDKIKKELKDCNEA